MNLTTPMLFAAALTLATSALAQEDQRVTDAKAAATSWLALADAGKYEESWEQSASLFRGAVSRLNWVQAGQQVRTPLGAVLSRQLRNARFTRTLPGVPDGEYVVIEYATSYANKAGAVETVTPMRDKDGSWKVSGWFIR